MNYERETYRIELRVVRSDGCVVESEELLGPTESPHEANDYWDAFLAAAAQVWERRLGI